MSIRKTIAGLNYSGKERFTLFYFPLYTFGLIQGDEMTGCIGEASDSQGSESVKGSLVAISTVPIRCKV